MKFCYCVFGDYLHMPKKIMQVVLKYLYSMIEKVKGILAKVTNSSGLQL